MNYSSLTTSLEGNWWVLKIKDKGGRGRYGKKMQETGCRMQEDGWRFLWRD